MNATLRWKTTIIQAEPRFARRLLMLLGGDACGGPRAQAMQAAVWMHRQGWKVKLVTMGPTVEPIDPAIEVESLGMCCDWRALLRLRGVAKRERPHVLHAHTTQASLLARAMRVVQRVPVLICTTHGEGGGTMLHRLTEPMADLTTASSHEAASRYVAGNRVPERRFRVVPNAVDTHRYCPDPQARRIVRDELGLGNAFTWISTAGFERGDDPDTLLTAFGRLLDRVPDQLLLLTGDGPFRADAERRAGSFGGRVRFLGARRDLDALLNGADACVALGGYGGLPRGLLEAASSALPVVATRSGCIAEAVRDGITGLLVEPGDSAALASAMQSVAQRPEGERRWMGLSGRQHALARFSMDSVMACWERIYDGLLSRNIRAL